MARLSNRVLDELAVVEVEAAKVGVRGVADDVIMEGFQEGAVGDDKDAGVGFGGVAREEVVQEGL